ncbi:MAG TPA: hypothetical protein VFG55_02325, partial [Rhodanobacteraceae bacterium]|nr:hypothetical protein [Rhodanobacteraceae bacterium]
NASVVYPFHDLPLLGDQSSRLAMAPGQGRGIGSGRSGRGFRRTGDVVSFFGLAPEDIEVNRRRCRARTCRFAVLRRYSQRALRSTT